MNRIANQFARWAVVWTICVSTISMPLPAEAAKPRLFRRWRESRQPAKPQKPVAKQQDKQPPVAEVTPQTEALTFSGVTGPPAAFHPGNITNLPGSNGQVFESNGDGTYTFGTDDGGVGGGATELSGLDDVSDTLVGNSGDFIGWNGAAWDDLTISLDTLSDATITSGSTGEVLRYSGTAWVDATLDFDDLANTTITSWASGEVPRWNGSALVDSKLASTDLSDFAATIAGTTNDVLGWNGSAWDDVVLTLDMVSDVTNAGSDGQVLASNGDGTATFETISATVDATGITDGYVYTADGDATPAWEAPAVGGLVTPDGATTITRSSEFNVRDYGASGSRKIFHVTSSAGVYTTKNASNSPIDHDFRVGQSCIIVNAGAVADVSAPDAAKSSVTNEGSAGSTTYTYKAVAIDADGGRSAASSAFTTTTGNATLSQSNYNVVKCDMPRGAVAIAIYKSDVLQTILDTAEPVRIGSDTVPGSFTLANNGGSIRLTVSAGHGIVTNDYVHIKTTSSGDTVYDVTAQCTTAGATTLDFSGVAYDGTATTASGYFRNAKMEWADMGASVPLHAIKYLPDQENPPMAHRPASAVWQGQVCQATASGTKYLYRCTRSIGTHMTGSSAPTWTTDPTVPVVDGEVTWMLEPFFVDVDIPAGAQRKTLFAEIATVPTSSTFTLDTAAGADISTNRLLCAHNDVLAARECLAAAQAYGQPASVYFPAGDYPFYLPSQMNTTYWTQIKNGIENRPSVLRLNSGIHNVVHPMLSIKCDPSATIRARYCQNSQIVEQLASYADHLLNAEAHFITASTENASIIGGEWEWAPWSGGFTEHDGGGSNSHGGHQYWLGDGQSGFAANLDGIAYGLTVRDVRVHWPSIHISSAVTGTDSDRKRNSKWLNCELYYGGGDGDQTFLPHGDFLFDGCLMETVTRMSSHGFYFNVANDNYRIVNSTFRRVATDAGKNCVSIRGSGGDTWTSNISIDNNTFINCGRINVGDPTTSNRVHRVAISNCLGTGVVVNVAEARGVTINGGVYGAITVVQDSRDVKISNLICDSIDLSSTDQNYDIDVSNVSFRQKIVIDDCTNVRIAGCRTRNPFVKSTNLVSGTYAWTQAGSGSTAYYLVNRATGGDPSLSSPTGVLIRDTATLTATPDLLLNGGNDAWFYGNVEMQTVAISGTSGTVTGGFTVTYNGNTTGSITNSTASPATAATVQTALRLLTGMSACYVAQSGTGTNLTFYVTGWATGSDPPQMTSTSTMSGGTPVITHATTVAYPGASTLAVVIGDSNRYDPDANPYGTIQTITATTGTGGILFSGASTNVMVKDCQLTSTWTPLYHLVGYATAGMSLTDVTFEGITTEYTGTTYGDTTAFRMWDFGASALVLANRIKIKDCKWLYPARGTTGAQEECRLYMDRGGDLTLEGLVLPSWGSGWELDNGGGVGGAVHVINCKVQNDFAEYTVNAAANTFTLVASGTYVDLFDTDGQPVMPDQGPNTFPVTSPQILPGNVYWYRNADSTLYDTQAHAAAGGATGLVDVTTANGPMRLRTLDASRRALLSGYEYLGDTTEFNIWGMCRGNTWRGSDSATYAQIASNQSDYQLIPLLSKHRLSSDASREIDGFDAPGAGSVSRRVQLMNVGAQDIVLKDDTDIGSAAQNRIACHTNADITLAAGETIELEYDVISQLWRTIFN